MWDEKRETSSTDETFFLNHKINYFLFLFFYIPFNKQSISVQMRFISLLATEGRKKDGAMQGNKDEN